MSSVSQSRHLRRLAGWVMLCVYFSALPGFFPVVFRAVAAVEGSHKVSISAMHGDWDVVLSHATPEASDHDSHAPHAADGGATSDDGDDHHHGPDHVFCVSAVDSHAVASSALFFSKISCAATLEKNCAAPECRIYPVPVYLNGVAARPPPGKPGWLVCLRTTVLIV